jgi:hypothetical protein
MIDRATLRSLNLYAGNASPGTGGAIGGIDPLGGVAGAIGEPDGNILLPSGS